MESSWRIVAFPLMLPWREEFWTLPLYFPELRVGVKQGWPAAAPYPGLPLPAEAEAPLAQLQNYAPGELTQWRAFEEYQQPREEVDELVRELRGESRRPAPERRASPEAWALAWQLEKMQADQEAQMHLVDRGQEWLTEIFRPEPWADTSGIRATTGVQEVADPDLARLRYLLWRRVMAPELTGSWAPLLLGRGSRGMFAALVGFSEFLSLPRLEVQLPGVRTADRWQAPAELAAEPAWRGRFREALEACLSAARSGEGLTAAGVDLSALAQEFAQAWPTPPSWWWPLEFWPRLEVNGKAWGPLLCGAPQAGDLGAG